jgi:D-alanyl-D-alanine carboxypeptidase (penicillin-binding protein 5/6)
LIDETGRVLWSRHPNLELANASTTKMVTALVAVEADDGEVVTISRQAASTGGGGPQLRAGDRFSVPQLLAALLMASSNDAAVALAEHVSGSEEAFVREMNLTARRLGATGTHFVNPHGLDAAGHYSTAHDLALFGRALLEEPLLAAIVRRRSLALPTEAGRERFENTNLLLEGYPGAIGIKTGYTIAAGNMLVGAARRDGRTLISVVMHSEDSFVDSERLLDYGWAKLRRRVLLPAGAEVAAIVFDPGGSTTAVASRDVVGSALQGEVTIAFESIETSTSPEEGGRVGTVNVSVAGDQIAAVPAIADRGVPPDPHRGLIVRILEWLLLVGSRVIPEPA